MICLQKEFKKFCDRRGYEYSPCEESFNEWVIYRNEKFPKNKYEPLTDTSKENRKIVNGCMSYNIYRTKGNK